MVSSSRYYNFSISFFFVLSSLSSLMYLVSFSASFCWIIIICSFISLRSWSLMLCSYSCFICSANSWVQVASCSFSDVSVSTCYSRDPFLLYRSLIILIKESEVCSSPDDDRIRFKMSLFKTKFFSRSLIWLWSFLIKVWSAGFDGCWVWF